MFAFIYKIALAEEEKREKRRKNMKEPKES
jgi:hypothetical protein